ncbi:MAG: dipeptidase [Cyclobacteriaceae bacterium]|nr:dipeptidase [Cyclobacteriaceae bacterium]
MQSRNLMIAILLLAAACGTKEKIDYTALPEEALRKVADSLAQAYIITDGHVDLPYRLKVINFRLEKEFLGIPIQSDDGDFDYERAKKGGLDAPFMSIYIPASNQLKPDMGKVLADSLIDMVRGIADAHPDKFGLAGTPAEVDAHFKAGRIALPMGMENGAPIGHDIANVKYFYNRGIRYVTLTHSKDNQICDSSYDTLNTWNGLSPFGEEVVREMNRVGIMVDISHVSDSTFYDVLKITKAPVIASHSSLRHFTPGWLRNMSDEMVVALKENGGVIQISFGSAFLDSEVTKTNNENRAKLQAILEEKGLKMRDPLAESIIEEFRKENPSLYADVKTVADHIDRAVELAGVDYVGFGSDFDGVGDTLPTGLKDVSQYPNLIYELLRRGYSPEDIEKICYKNVWRVWNKVIEVSEK